MTHPSKSVMDPIQTSHLISIVTLDRRQTRSEGCVRHSNAGEIQFRATYAQILAKFVPRRRKFRGQTQTWRVKPENERVKPENERATTLHSSATTRQTRNKKRDLQSCHVRQVPKNTASALRPMLLRGGTYQYATVLPEIEDSPARCHEHKANSAFRWEYRGVYHGWSR